MNWTNEIKIPIVSCWSSASSCAILKAPRKTCWWAPRFKRLNSPTISPLLFQSGSFKPATINNVENKQQNYVSVYYLDNMRTNEVIIGSLIFDCFKLNEFFLLIVSGAFSVRPGTSRTDDRRRQLQYCNITDQSSGPAQRNCTFRQKHPSVSPVWSPRSCSLEFSSLDSMKSTKSCTNICFNDSNTTWYLILPRQNYDCCFRLQTIHPMKKIKL